MKRILTSADCNYLNGFPSNIDPTQPFTVQICRGERQGTVLYTCANQGYPIRCGLEIELNEEFVEGLYSFPPINDVPFDRESRYIVMKISDVEAGLSLSQQAELSSLVSQVDQYRMESEKPPLGAVVVESDWPEYEPTWQMLAHRVGRS